MDVYVLLPIDLYHDISLLRHHMIFLVEEIHFFNRSSKLNGGFRFNALKPVYHRATMRCYYEYLISKKINCSYVELADDWMSIVDKYVTENDSRLNFYDPVDRTIETKLRKYFRRYNIIDTPRFTLNFDDLKMYRGPLRQTSFYGWIRKQTGILMVGTGNNIKPTGGRLTFDNYNRKRPYGNIKADVNDNGDYTNNEYVIEAFKYIRGIMADKDIRLRTDDDLVLKFPVDRKGSVARLNFFIKHNLSRFGDYQDVMLDNDNSFVFHSALSPMINIGILTPKEVVNAVLIYYRSLSETKKKSMINNVEGFIRQILGWREFTRYMYEYHSDKYLHNNFFNASLSLSKEWYNGTTGILPVDLCIKKAFKYGYLHHIERLMIIANYMTLTSISPHEMYTWFMEFALDSYDWVMEFNVYCMASYSTGRFTSKPYISSSKYILRMSTYKCDPTVPWCEKWDDAFWKFISKHKEKIKKIGRIATLLRYI